MTDLLDPCCVLILYLLTPSRLLKSKWCGDHSSLMYEGVYLVVSNVHCLVWLAVRVIWTHTCCHRFEGGAGTRHSVILAASASTSSTLFLFLRNSVFIASKSVLNGIGPRLPQLCPRVGYLLILCAQIFTPCVHTAAHLAMLEPKPIYNLRSDRQGAFKFSPN